MKLSNQVQLHPELRVDLVPLLDVGHGGFEDSPPGVLGFLELGVQRL